jgi:thiamine biosynthesis lipoprotein
MRKRPMVVKAVRFCRRVAQCGRAVRQLFRDERPWIVKGKEWSRQSLAYLRNLRLSPAQRRFLTELWSQYSLHVIAVFLLVAAVFLLRELGRPSLLLQEIRGETMGTTYSVKYRTIRSAALAEMEKQNITANIEKRLNVVNDLMSTYRPNSEISRFNARQSSLPFKLSPQTNQVIALAFEVNQLSGGAFDITVGPIVNAYHFGPPENGTNLPTTETLDTLFEYVGSHLLEFDPRSSTLSKLDPRVYCDLSAIAKGYGVDQLADLFDALKIKHYLIESWGRSVTLHAVE